MLINRLFFLSIWVARSMQFWQTVFYREEPRYQKKQMRGERFERSTSCEAKPLAPASIQVPATGRDRSESPVAKELREAEHSLTELSGQSTSFTPFVPPPVCRRGSPCRRSPSPGIGTLRLQLRRAHAGRRGLWPRLLGGQRRGAVMATPLPDSPEPGRVFSRPTAAASSPAES